MEIKKITSQLYDNLAQIYQQLKGPQDTGLVYARKVTGSESDMLGHAKPILKNPDGTYMIGKPTNMRVSHAVGYTLMALLASGCGADIEGSGPTPDPTYRPGLVAPYVNDANRRRANVLYTGAQTNVTIQTAEDVPDPAQSELVVLVKPSSALWTHVTDPPRTFNPDGSIGDWIVGSNGVGKYDVEAIVYVTGLGETSRIPFRVGWYGIAVPQNLEDAITTLPSGIDIPANQIDHQRLIMGLLPNIHFANVEKEQAAVNLQQMFPADFYERIWKTSTPEIGTWLDSFYDNIELDSSKPCIVLGGKMYMPFFVNGFNFEEDFPLIVTPGYHQGYLVFDLSEVNPGWTGEPNLEAMISLFDSLPDS